MVTKKHVTALGRPFDMAALVAKNEKTRAVGNMSVNARGDIIDSNNNVITDANQRVNKMYKNVTQSVIDKEVKQPGKPKVKAQETTPKELADLDDDVPNPKKG